MTDRDSYRSCPGKTCPGPDFLRIAGVGVEKVEESVAIKIVSYNVQAVYFRVHLIIFGNVDLK